MSHHFEYGKALVKSNRNENGDYEVYGSNGIVGKHSEFLINEPCLIVGRKGAAGEVHLSLKPSWPIDTTYFVKRPAVFDLKFLYFQLKTLRLSSLEKSNQPSASILFSQDVIEINSLELSVCSSNLTSSFLFYLRN